MFLVFLLEYSIDSDFDALLFDCCKNFAASEGGLMVLELLLICPTLGMTLMYYQLSIIMNILTSISFASQYLWQFRLDSSQKTSQPILKDL